MYNKLPEAVQDYLKAYHYRTELHAHTQPCSGCSHLLPEDMIRRLKAENYDAVVIVNHFYKGSHLMKEEDPVSVYLEDFHAAEAAGKKYGVRVLLGAELRFAENENDYLVYGIDEAFLRDAWRGFDMGIEAFYQKYHKDALLFIQAHPFRSGQIPVATEFLDGIETMNMHPFHNSRVSFACRYADRNQFPIVVAGTDLHEPDHVGMCALRTKVLPESEAQLVEILKSGDYLFEIGGCLMFPMPIK